MPFSFSLLNRDQLSKERICSFNSRSLFGRAFSRNANRAPLFKTNDFIKTFVKISNADISNGPVFLLKKK